MNGKKKIGISFWPLHWEKEKWGSDSFLSPKIAFTIRKQHEVYTEQPSPWGNGTTSSG